MGASTNDSASLLTNEPAFANESSWFLPFGKKRLGTHQTQDTATQVDNKENINMRGTGSQHGTAHSQQHTEQKEEEIPIAIAGVHHAFVTASLNLIPAIRLAVTLVSLIGIISRRQAPPREGDASLELQRVRGSPNSTMLLLSSTSRAGPNTRARGTRP